jgi:RNA polymerase sigma-70 factor (ECF subfamily)
MVECIINIGTAALFMKRTFPILANHTSEPLPEAEALCIERAAQGDQVAFTSLYDKCVRRIYRHVYYRVSNHVDTEDIVQEVFIKAWKAIGKYRITGAPFVAWLITIAHNLVVDYYKAHKKQMLRREMEAASDCSETDPGVLTEISLNRALVRKAILQLKGEKQQVIMMRFVDGFSYREIAQALNKSEGAVRVIQYRALNELRRMLKVE